MVSKIQIGWLAALTAIVASMSIIAGCGGGGDPSSTSSATPVIAKASYVRRAKAICKGALDRTLTEGVALLKRTEKTTGKSPKEAQQELISTWLAPMLEKTVASLRALGAPSGDEDRVDGIYKALEEVIELAKAEPSRYLYEQVNAKHPYRKAERLATAYGIPECGQP